MPGSLDKNLLRAYLKEELGVYLLRGLATVAPVPRPQDTGIDAIATLLRQSTTRKLIPENSFFVQLKSASIRQIEFSGDELTWFSQLQLPYFLGSVDQQTMRLSMYGCHNWRAQRREQHGSTSVVFLLDTPGGQTGSIRSRAPSVVGKDGAIQVWLGPPVMAWSVPDLSQPDFLQRSYSILKPHLQTEDRNIRWAPLRYAELLEWQTNQPPRCVGCGQAAHGIEHFRTIAEQILASVGPTGLTDEIISQRMYEAGLQTILPELTLPIRALASHALHQGCESDWSQVYDFVKYMRRHNCDPACGDWLENEAKRRFGGLPQQDHQKGRGDTM